MPNHFHLLMHEKEPGSISRCLHALQTSYAKAINKRYQRHGHLFQDTYQRVRVEDNNQLLHLSRYIHMNPVHAGLVQHPQDWPYSSYKDYIGARKGSLPCSEIILSQFPNQKAYHDFVVDSNHEKIIEELVLE